MANPLSFSPTSRWWGLSVFILLILGFSSTNLQAQDLDPKEEKKTYKKARRLLDAENYEKAKPYFEQLVDLKPNNVIYSYEAGLAFFNSKVDKGNALEYFRNSLAATKGDTIPEIIFYIARSYQFLGQFDEAIVAYDDYLRVTEKAPFEPGFAKDIPRYIEMCEYGRNYFENNKEHVVVENLGQNINTEFPEYSPVVKDDETEILFTSRRPSSTGNQLYNDGKYFEDVYYSVFNNQVWDVANNIDSTNVNMNSGINTPDHDATSSLSGDEKKFFIYRDNDIWVSELVDGTWAAPHRLGSTINSERGQETSVLLTQSGNTLFVVSDRKDGYGKRDIWKSSLQSDGSWGSLENLGASINTKHDEDAPFLSADGNTLYFSSKGHSTMGGFDVFKSTMESGKWTSPENIGAPINTPGDEIFFVTTADGSVGYYASSRQGGYGDMDIYRLSLRCKNIATAQVRGIVISEASRKAIGASIIVSDEVTGDLIGTYQSDPTTGKYAMYLPTDREFQFAITVNDYMTHTGTFSVPRQCELYSLYQEIKIKDINDDKGRLVSQQADVQNAFFDFDKALKKEYGLRAITAKSNSKELDSMNTQFIAMLDTSNVPNFEIITTDHIEVATMELAAPAPIQNYNDWIDRGERMLAKQDLQLAKLSYLEALKNRPESNYAQAKLAEIDAANGDATATEDAQYEALIKRGDELRKMNQNELAILSYTEALKLKPAEVYPKEAIQQTDATLASQLVQVDEKRYHDLMVRGDEQLQEKTYDLAKISYLEAIRLKPEEAAPYNRLALIDQKTDASENADAAKAWVEKGDALLAQKEYELAKLSYVEALNINPGEQGAKDQLLALSNSLNNAQKESESKRFEKLLDDADKLMTENRLDEAKHMYLMAASLEPEDAHAQNQIRTINAEQSSKAKAKRNVKYFTLIAEADQAVITEDFATARSTYEEAIHLMPMQGYPRERVARLDAVLTRNDEVNRSTQYLALIEEGDQAQKAGNQDEAKAKFFQAKLLQPKMELADLRVDEANRQLRKQSRENGQAAYARMVTTADDAALDGDYSTARTALEEAQKSNPDADYPTAQLKKLDDWMHNNRDLASEEQYNEAVAMGDQALQSEDLDKAKLNYITALEIKPNSDYPRGKIIEINDRIYAAMETQSEREYQELIALGDLAMADGNYDQAKLSYLEAHHRNESNDYATTKVDEINRMVMGQAMTPSDKEIQEQVASADALYFNQELDEAKSGYMKALQINPAAPYPKSIVEISNGYMVSDATSEEDVALAEQIAKADQAFADSRFERAKEEYVKALKMRPGTAYAKEQILSGNSILKTRAAEPRDKQYLERIESADIAYLEGNKQKAMDTYSEALALKPTSRYPKNQLARLEGREPFQAAEPDYRELVSKGNVAFDKADYLEAKDAFLDALALRPNEFYPRQRVSDANRFLTQKAGDKPEYQEAVTQADDQMVNGRIEEARMSYLKALKLRPTQQYPKDRIAAADHILAQEAKPVTNKRYAEMIETADAMLLVNKREDARQKYLEAIALKNNETYPQQMVKRIENEGTKGSNRSAEALIADGDAAFDRGDLREAKSAYFRATDKQPDNDYAKSQIGKINDALIAKSATEQEKQMSQLVKQGDEAWLAGDFHEARDQYSNAAQVDADWLVMARLAEIDDMGIDAPVALAEVSEEETAIEETPATDSDALIAAADQAYDNKDYAEASKNYKAALTADPADSHAKSRLAEIEQMSTGSSDEDPYTTAIAKADEAYNNKNYKAATENYQAALAANPTAEYAKNRLDEINKINAGISSNQQFNAAIAKADREFDGGQYESARKSYEQALSLKPGEEHPTARLKTINEKAYKRLVAEGDRDLSAGEYEAAIANYEAASAAMPDMDYPKNKITELRQQMAAVAQEGNGTNQDEDDQTASSDPEMMVFKNINFDFDKSDLRKASEAELNKVSTYMNENEELELRVDGHTDAIGTEDYNMKLSERRAMSAEQYLKQQGLEMTRMEIRAFGESKPIAKNQNDDGSDNPEGRQLNRRVEFKVTAPEQAYDIILKF